MAHTISFCFSDKNIQKYIKNSKKLVVKNMSFEITKIHYNLYTNYLLEINADSVSSRKWDLHDIIIKLNKLFDFFIKNKCFFLKIVFQSIPFLTLIKIYFIKVDIGF